eukprot:PITA_18408
MLAYDFEIICKKGKKNVVVDALSRKDEDVEALLCTISIIQPDWINEARDEWKTDEEVWELIQKLQQDPSTSDTFSWKNDSLCTQLAHSSSYHPQYDGKTKIVNKCLEGYLHCFVSDKQTKWIKWLPLAEWWYNTSFHTAAKMTPFMALYGHHPPSITSYLRENSKVQAVEHHIEHQQQVLQLLKDNLKLAQNRMKQQANQHRSESSFDVGD